MAQAVWHEAAQQLAATTLSAHRAVFPDTAPGRVGLTGGLAGAGAVLLEPYAGHRYRVQRLLELAGARHPRRGPRRTLPTHLPTRFGRGGPIRSR